MYATHNIFAYSNQQCVTSLFLNNWQFCYFNYSFILCPYNVEERPFYIGRKMFSIYDFAFGQSSNLRSFLDHCIFIESNNF